jgi:hypothetical protein
MAYAGRMSKNPVVHEIQIHIVQRVIMTAGGLFALIMTPLELGRAIWPLNIGTPFFALIIFGGMSIGATFIYGGLVAPSVKLVFRHGKLTVEKRFLWGTRATVIALRDIKSITPIGRTDSDDGETWVVEIAMSAGRKLGSRRFETEETARQYAAEFRKALGLPAT